MTAALTQKQIAAMLAQLAGAQSDDGRDTLRRLAAPFAVDAVSWRLGATTADKSKGMALAYIDSRDVQDRLDDIMGADWQCEYAAMPDGSYCCRIGLRIDGEWRWRSDGAVMLSESTKADAKEMANKGSYSDAFKRAAVKWGIGRYLYTLDSPWVDCKAKGNTVVMADGAQNKLRAHLAKWMRDRGYNSDGQLLADGAKATPPAPQSQAEPEPKQPPQQPKEKPAPKNGAGAAAAQRATAKTDGATTGGAKPPAEGQSTAEMLLAGIPHHEGLRDIVRRINAATKAVTAGRQGETVATLDAAYKSWERWMAATMPQLEPSEQAKVYAAMEHYGKAANKLDAAVKAAAAKQKADAAAAGADGETGELPDYETAGAVS